MAGPSLRPLQLTRVLVVDDSVVARRLVARAVEEDDALELAGVAANRLIALEKVSRLRPDVVVLDLEMPEMDGFETLKALRVTDPELPVIVFSHLTARGADATLEALALGAKGFATKSSAETVSAHGDQIRDELLPLIKALTTRSIEPASAAYAPANSVKHRRASAVVVAVSTGGPNALAAIVGELPADLAAPIFIVQHMPAVFTRQLAERLNGLGVLTVVEAESGQIVTPGRVYIAPGGRHMTVVRTGADVSIDIFDGPPENSCRPAADVLFRSAVQVYGGELLGLVLTGMGHDGLRGAEAICAAGGTVIAQDQASSVIGSMPGAVTAAGLADAVLPLGGIAAELERRLDGRD